MITYNDIGYIEKIAPVAQLLEMLCHMDQPAVRSPDVLVSMSKQLWEVYWYLNTRLHDEVLGCACANGDASYFEEVEKRSRNAVDA